jgi:hypothetical protein
MSSRAELAERCLTGSGLELGAGANPTPVDAGVKVTYADKRSRQELKTYFASDNVTVGTQMKALEKGGFDFFMAHHVIEHCSNVLEELARWISYLWLARAAAVLLVAPALGACGGPQEPTPIPELVQFSALGAFGEALLTWQPVANTGVAAVAVRRSAAGFPVSPTDGDPVYTGPLSTFTDGSLATGADYYYAAFPLDLHERPWAGRQSLGRTSAYPLTFASPPALFSNPFNPAAADISGDGCVEFFGTVNDGTGRLIDQSPGAIGLGAIYASGRVFRDERFADFNGDGYVDVVANAYSSLNDSNSVALLLFNNGDGTFAESPEFRALDIRGYGETIVVADFNNDRASDIFLPYYSHNSASEHSYLLINDGAGRFKDISDQAGVSLRNLYIKARPESAQAVDFNLDGWIDLYVAGHLFFNNHDLTFSDRRFELNLPRLFDEGAKFLDWNNDGYLDLIVLDPDFGPSLYVFDGHKFNFAGVIPEQFTDTSYGLNVADFNNDGREDFVISARFDVFFGDLGLMYLNAGDKFITHVPPILLTFGNGPLAIADINDDGRLDMARTTSTGLEYYENTTNIAGAGSIMIDVVGPAPTGFKNQHGRVVKITPQDYPDVTMTRIVDGGSGYLSQNQYELIVGTPFPGAHTVQVYFAPGMIQFVVYPGERKRVFEDGRVEDIVGRCL